MKRWTRWQKSKICQYWKFVISESDTCEIWADNAFGTSTILCIVIGETGTIWQGCLNKDVLLEYLLLSKCILKVLLLKVLKFVILWEIPLLSRNEMQNIAIQKIFELTIFYCTIFSTVYFSFCKCPEPLFRMLLISHKHEIIFTIRFINRVWPRPLTGTK